MIAAEKRPTLAQLTPSPKPVALRGWAEVLGLVLYVPVVWEVGRVE